MTDREEKQDPHLLGRFVAAGAALVLLVGVVCQFIQHTDPTFPLLYFTIDSAILAGITFGLSALSTNDDWLASVRGTATVGVVVSGLIFATVIAPNTPTGTWIQPHDDYWVRTATILIHGVAPFLVMTAFLLLPGPRRPMGVELRAWTWWPVTYLIVVTAVCTLGQIPMPYVFLRPSTVGWPVVVGAVIVLTAIITAIGAGILALHQSLRSRWSVRAD